MMFENGATNDEHGEMLFENQDLRNGNFSLLVRE